MTAKSHTSTSLAIALSPIVFYYDIDIQSNIQYLMLYIAGVIFGSLFPDIDEENSSIARNVELIAGTLNTLIGHRTLTHNIFIYAPVIIYGIVNFYTPIGVFVLAIGIGAILHILEDSITNSGVNWALKPLITKFALLPRQFRFQTNGNFESFVYFPLTMTFLLFEIYSLIVKNI